MERVGCELSARRGRQLDSIGVVEDSGEYQKYLGDGRRYVGQIRVTVTAKSDAPPQIGKVGANGRLDAGRANDCPRNA